jgi:RNA polymerase sigma factor (sigma-70 family)
MNRVLRHLRRAALLQAGKGPTDAHLLESFLTQRDEAAFELLLLRHGPMVLGVCQRVLRHTQDAEDAFQATFLVLARKAGSLRSRELLGNWLYGVAHRTALKARAMSMKRRAREKEAGALPRPQAAADRPSEELLAELDAALCRLPDKYRVPIVLCELEGKGRREAARLLGLAEGTLSWRLAHAKKLLARKLSRDGGAPSVSALALTSALPAGLPRALLNTTARAALRVVRGEALSAGMVSAQVVTLTEGVIKAMLWSKLKGVGAVAFALLLGAGLIGLSHGPAVAQSGGRGAAPPAARTSADELEELRLEVAALRKGLEATRQRVRALESEVGLLKASRPDSVRARAAWKLMEAAPAPDAWQQAAAAQAWGKRWYLAEKLAGERPYDPVAEAEAAVSKLKKDQNDKQALDALDKALQRLRERQKRPAGRGTPGDPGRQ